jgi:hypothetical protein
MATGPELPTGSGSRRAAAGFALFELVAAVVILGAILIMTVRGSEILVSLRALIVLRQFEQIAQKVEAYRSVFGRLPGDDVMAPARFRRPRALTWIGPIRADTSGNDQIDGLLSDFRSPEGEQFAVWRDLRLYGSLDGDASLVGFSAMPEHVFGGVLGFDQGNLGQKPPGSLCATRIPGRAAQSIDARLDDGRIDSGLMVGTANYATERYNHFAVPDSEPYDVEKEYIICLQLRR